MRKSIVKNYFYNAFYQVLLLLAPVITAPYISRVLEPDGVGIVSYAESVVAYFTLFATMGITTYGQREISYVQEDRYRRSVVFWNTKILGLCSSVCMLVAYMCFARLQRQSVVYLLLSLNIVTVLVDVTWFFQGMEEFGKVALRNAVFKCLNIAYVFLFVRQKGDLSLYVLGRGLFTVLGNFSLWFYLPKYIGRISRSEIHPFRNFSVVLSLFVPAIAVQVYTVMDKTMIGLITGDYFQNGYYEQSVKISRMVLALVTSLGAVMISRIGYYYGRNEQEEIKRLIYRSYRFAWFLSIPICLGLVAVAGNFVPWFLGPGYDTVVTLLHVLALLILVVGISNVTGIQYMIPTKRQNLFSFTVLLGAGVNFILNLVLIRFFKATGAAVASVAAETVITIVQMILVRKELAAAQVLKEGIHYYIAGGVMFSALMIVGRTMTPSVPHTAAMVVCGAAIYFLTLLIEQDTFFITNVKKLLRWRPN